MKTGIHPDYVETTVTCTCGSSFTTRSTAKNGVIHADICSSCHPFYTGKQKIMDTGGRVARFERRFGTRFAVQNSPGQYRERPHRACIVQIWHTHLAHTTKRNVPGAEFGTQLKLKCE